MNAGRGIDRVIADWLVEEAPGRAPDRILDEAGLQIDRTTQRRFAAKWREPMIVSTGRLVAAAAIVLVAVFGAGWLGRTTAAVGQGVGTLSPPTSPVASSGPTLGSFRTARDAICIDANQRLRPLKSRFLGIWDGSITTTQRADWVASLRTFATGYDELIGRLAAVPVPPDLAASHNLDVGRFTDLASLIRATATYLAAHQDAQAEGVDHSTDAIAGATTAWETSLALSHCP